MTLRIPWVLTDVVLDMTLRGSSLPNFRLIRTDLSTYTQKTRVTYIPEAQMEDMESLLQRYREILQEKLAQLQIEAATQALKEFRDHIPIRVNQEAIAHLPQ